MVSSVTAGTPLESSPKKVLLYVPKKVGSSTIWEISSKLSNLVTLELIIAGSAL